MFRSPYDGALDKLPPSVAVALMALAIALPIHAHADTRLVGATGSCKLAQDATTTLESQIDVIVATLDECDAAGTLDDSSALKGKALLIKLRSDIAEVRRRHRGDLLDADRARFSMRLTRILSMLPVA